MQEQHHRSVAPDGSIGRIADTFAKHG